MTDTERRTSDLERRTTALEAADHLAAALEENTVALNRVQRQYRWVLVLVGMIALTLGSVIKVNYDGAISQCRTGNVIRVEHNAKWDAITAFLEDNGTGDEPNGVAFLALLDEDLPRADCSEINWLGQ